jgi:hypothetical protein
VSLSFSFSESIKSLFTTIFPVSYFVQEQQLSFSQFQERCRCTLENAIEIVRKHSGKSHVVVAIDEVNRIPSKTLLREFMSVVTPLMDSTGDHRVQFVFTSLTSGPLRDFETWSGRKHQVRVSCFFTHYF